MMSKNIRKSIIVIFILLIIWVTIAQSCMKFRVSDSDAKKQFNAIGLVLQTKYLILMVLIFIT